MTALVNLVTLAAVDPPGASLRFHLLGDDTPAGGVGGWEVLPRPRQRGAAEWTGVEPWTLDLPLLTTGLDVRPGLNATVEPKVAALIGLAQKVPGHTRPALLDVTGPIRVPRPGMRWVIAAIEWGPQVRRSDGQRVQQEMTVRLLEHVTAALLLGPAAAANARNG